MYIEQKYLLLASSRLQQFKRKGDYLWNFRCPYCGDSQTNLTKARGYVFRKESNLIYKCHNCGIGANLNNFLKHLDSQLHDDYIKEKFLDNGKDRDTQAYEKFSTHAPYLKGSSPLKSKLVKKVSSLDHNHYAKKYVQKRKIPSDKHYLLYHTESFNQWSNEWCHKKLETNSDCARLIIPCHNEENKFIACQGRAYDNNDFKLRYQTSKVHEDTQLIFGQDRLKSDKPKFAVEGPIDSLFVDNCVAVLGFNKFKLLSKDYTIIPDNDRRNTQVLKSMSELLELGYSMVLWPDEIKEKDINDMIMSGMSVEKLKTIIENNTYQGNMALLKFTNWRKINV